MKKYLYISAMLLATALLSVSCKNEEPDLFENSAAERAEIAAKDYKEALIANGGKWVMEYFTNSKEPGYVYVVTFSKDGSVKMSANHKWVGKKFVSSVSLWDIISDNGPVLSFSSYNPVFHVLSEPEDIVDPDAGESAGGGSGEIDEQGYGHEGDYEFVLMEKQDSFIRLKGKKYGETIMMRRLDANTDDEAYFAELALATDKMFNAKFSTQIVTDGATGERFVMTNGGSGVVSLYPRAGDPITQTVTANAIVTVDGIRFASVVEVPRANGEFISFQTFAYKENGTLVCAEDDQIVITAKPLSELFGGFEYSWTIDESTVSGVFATEYQKVANDFKTRYKNKRNLKSITFSQDVLNGEEVNCIKIAAGTSTGKVYITTANTDDLTLTVGLTGDVDKNASRFLIDIVTLRPFIDMLCSQSYKLSAESLLLPSKIKAVSSANESDYFYVTVQ